ncbi:P-loop containing nucleoside triphosphate hydrolase protein [Dacryopinax primogenitus]|uniref:Signal recognition particle receptor subunit beta n=1 Tax=Dacryopinax primogenitus (strain DJM 731) TaxID=1858805 RepID=M5GED7_DACPD|nr:P-loop containing nucleoside triphosphate hydrolase protein [Dacryopinax primogenitus]EJU05332.1 P-loop containing nucleoside triphosphate hydrolase protein [Dacryopinax primogenitus]
MDAKQEQPPSTPLLVAVEEFSRQHTTLLAALFGLLLAIVVTLFLVNRKSQKNKIRNVLLVGPLESGKTALFANMVYEQHLPSHTSLQPNIGLLQQDKKTFRLIDIPGHPRIRSRFREHLATVDGLVFTVDANTVARNGVAVAEHLHLVLSAVQPLSRSPRLLLLATHADLVEHGSHPAVEPVLHPARIRVVSVLEREVEKRRLAGANQKLGGAMEALGAVAGGGKQGLFGSSSAGGTGEGEEIPDGTLEVGRDGVWRFGDEWEIGVSSVGSGDRTEGLRSIVDWLDSL